MKKTPRFFNRFFDALDLLTYWTFVVGAAASALAALAAVVLAIVSGYANRPDLAGSAGSVLGKGIIGLFVFLILARQTRKQHTRSKDMRNFDAKFEERAKSVEGTRRSASAQGIRSGESG